MKNKEKKKEFRHSLRGYKKEDVNRYILSMDKTAKEDMLECRRNFQNQIAVDKKSFLYLIGTTLEYSGGLNGKGFVFNNPNASRTCGCGESFSL